MALCRARCGDHLLLGGIRFSKTDIGADGIVEQIHILKYHRHIGQQAVAGKFPDVVSAHRDAAAVHIVKPREQVADRRLAGTARSHNRRRRVLRNLKTYSL